MSEAVYIDPEDVEIHKGNVLGDGGAGQVFSGTLIKRQRSGQLVGKQSVAVKVLDDPDNDANGVPRELRLILAALQCCQYVCKPYGYTKKEGKTCLVLRLYRRSLAKYIETFNGLRPPLRVVLSIGKQLTEAIRQLHTESRIAHFDVKPENILLDDKDTCFLCDFSIAKHIPAGESSVPLPQHGYGSARYMAPEQIADRANTGIGFKADTWGVAATLLTMYTGQAPFAAKRDIEVMNSVSSGALPTVPGDVEPRFAACLRRCFVTHPDLRRDVSALRHELSQLLEVLRIEAGGKAAVPAAVLASSEMEVSSSSMGSAAIGAARRESSPALMQKVNVSSVPATASRGANVVSASGRAPSAGRAQDVDLLSGDPLPLVSTSGSAQQGSEGDNLAAAGVKSWKSTPGGLPSSANGNYIPLRNGGGSGSAAPEHEAVVISTGNTGTLGIRCLFRSFWTLLRDPNDEKQMTGVALVPGAHDVPGGGSSVSGGSGVVHEAVSVSAGKRLTWWDISERGAPACSVELSKGGRMSPYSTGRSIVASSRFVVVGTDRSTLGVWQFRDTKSASALQSGAGALPECVMVASMSTSNTGPGGTGSGSSGGRDPTNKIYDIALQPRWLEDAGGRWLVGASSQGKMALWDTETWQEIFTTHGTGGSNGVFYSCSAMPGSNMVALASRSPNLVQVYDCRQPPHNVVAVMSCQLDPASPAHVASTEDAAYCVSCVPARGGVMPSQLLLGSKDGRVAVWDLRVPNALLMVAKLGREKVLGCAASPCGTRILAGASKGQVVMIDWKGEIQGTPIYQSHSPYVSHWEQDSQMFKWPKIESGILRVTTCNLAYGSVLANSFVQ